MIQCPYNNSCIKLNCDLACSDYAEFEHWANRCNLNISNPVFSAKDDELQNVISIIDRRGSSNFDSNYINLVIHSSEKPAYTADLLSYVLICRYGIGSGFYGGVYKLNFSEYLDEIKKSWTSRNSSEELENIKIWNSSAKFLVISGLNLIRFGDFESQTLLSIFQERYDKEKYTFIVLEKGKFGLLGKSDSVFYAKLKQELVSRGAKL